MGRKIKYAMVFFLFAVLTGCADFEFHVKKEAYGTRPSLIVLGPFDIRNMNYDPYVSDEFKDALKYEFFKRGYGIVTVSRADSDKTKDSEWAAERCRENSGDILVSGVISQRESGFLTDRKIFTLISFTVYGKDGKIIAEGFYNDNRSAGEDAVRRDAAERLVSELLSKLGRVN